jgi:hypothetical protein
LQGLSPFPSWRAVHPGDDAPDARLLALNGKDYFHLRERAGARPLMVVFGSYT